MVTDRAEAGVLPFEESKKDIINFLEGQDKVDILKNKIESLRKDAKIEFYNQDYNPENIQKKIYVIFEVSLFGMWRFQKGISTVSYAK